MAAGLGVAAGLVLSAICSATCSASAMAAAVSSIEASAFFKRLVGVASSGVVVVSLRFPAERVMLLDDRLLSERRRFVDKGTLTMDEDQNANNGVELQP